MANRGVTLASVFLQQRTQPCEKGENTAGVTLIVFKVTHQGRRFVRSQ